MKALDTSARMEMQFGLSAMIWELCSENVRAVRFLYPAAKHYSRVGRWSPEIGPDSPIFRLMTYPLWFTNPTYVVPLLGLLDAWRLSFEEVAHGPSCAG